MVRTEHVQNKLRELGFTFSRQADRVMIWHQRNGPRRVNLPRRDSIPDARAAILLQQAGETDEAIALFLAASKS